MKMRDEVRQWKINFIKEFVNKYDIKSINIDNIDSLADITIQSYIRQIDVASELVSINNELNDNLLTASEHIKELVKENKILKLQFAIRDSEDYTKTLKLELDNLLLNNDNSLSLLNQNKLIR